MARFSVKSKGRVRFPLEANHRVKSRGDVRILLEANPGVKSRGRVRWLLGVESIENVPRGQNGYSVS